MSNSQNRRERYRKQVRKDILDAAERVFASQGYGARMEAVAQEAGLSTGSLYNYFKNKEDLYYRLISEKGRHYNASLATAVMMEGDFQELLRNFIKAETEFFEENKDLWKILFDRQAVPLHSGSSKEAERLHVLHREHLAAVSTLMWRGIGEGALAERDPVELAMLINALWRGFALRHLMDESAPTPVERRDVIYDLFMNGAGART